MLNQNEYENVLSQCYHMLDENDNVPEDKKEQFKKLFELIDEYENYWFPITP